jgi:hypothetical protein
MYNAWVCCWVHGAHNCTMTVVNFRKSSQLFGIFFSEK